MNHSQNGRAELNDLARDVAGSAERFVETIKEVASGVSPETAFPLLLLATADIALVGARLGAWRDVLPPDRFEPDAGPDADFAPLVINLANLLGSVNDYVETAGPWTADEILEGSLSADIVTAVSDLNKGLQHYQAGRYLEALWWWQYSYFSSWGDRIITAQWALHAILAEVRLVVDDEIVAEAEFEALHGD